MASENIAQQVTQTATQAVTSQMQKEAQRQQQNTQRVEGTARGIAQREGYSKLKKEAMKIEPVKKTVDKANTGIDKITGKAKETIMKTSPAKMVMDQMKKAFNGVKKVMGKAMKKAVEMRTKALVQASKAKTKAVNAGIDAAGKALAPITAGISEGVAQGAKQVNEVVGKAEQGAIKASGEVEKKAIDAGTKMGQDMGEGAKGAIVKAAAKQFGMEPITNIKDKIDSVNKAKEAGQGDVGAVVMKQAGNLAMNAMTRG